jgi:two-component sensor histidine kinase/PAS domain-containing protein
LDRNLDEDLKAIAGIEAVPAILAVVCQITGMGFAAIARVTDTQWLACATRDDIDFGLPTGGELPLHTTICNEILEHRRPVIIEDVASDPLYRDHPTPALYGLGSYISWPIVLPDGSFFGTLCAVDRAARPLQRPQIAGTIALFADLIARHLATDRQMATIQSLLDQRGQLIQQLRAARDGALGELRRTSIMFDHAPNFMAVLEGPGHLFVSANPAYRALIGGRSVIGRTVAEALPEAVEQGFTAILDKVFATGEPVSMRGARFVARGPHGEPLPEQFLDFLYQPIRSDEAITGIFITGYDVTGYVQQGRRQAALAELGDRLRTIRDAEEITHVAAQIMAEVLHATRAGIGTVDPEHESVLMHANWCAPGARPVEGVYHFRDYGSYIDDLKRGETVIVADVRQDERTAASAQAMAALGIRVLLNFPVLEQGRFVLVAFVHFDTLRPLSREDVRFVEQIADRTQAALARLKAEEQQQILHRELGHRMKNLLAIAQAITQQTLRQADSLKDGSAAVSARLHALARAQDILTATSWQAADIAAIVDTAMAPHQGDGGRIVARGPAITLGTEQVLGLSLALHELATNATKYGALSVPGGRVDLSWTCEGEAFGLSWVESGGPPVTPPARRGLGTRLIESAAPPYFNGTGQIDYHPQGVRFTLAGRLG